MYPGHKHKLRSVLPPRVHLQPRGLTHEPPRWRTPQRHTAQKMQRGSLGYGRVSTLLRPFGQVRSGAKVRARLQVPSKRPRIEPSPPQMSKRISWRCYCITEYPIWASVDKGGRVARPTPCPEELHEFPNRGPSRRRGRGLQAIHLLRPGSICVLSQPSPKWPIAASRLLGEAFGERPYLELAIHKGAIRGGVRVQHTKRMRLRKRGARLT